MHFIGKILFSLTVDGCVVTAENMPVTFTDDDWFDLFYQVGSIRVMYQKAINIFCLAFALNTCGSFLSQADVTSY